MKWIAGLGQRLGNLFSGENETSDPQRRRVVTVTTGLERILGCPPDENMIKAVFQHQQALGTLQRSLLEQGAGSNLVHYDGLSHLKPLRESQQGYVVVFFQSFLSDVLNHLIRTPGGKTIANVVFQPHDDPSAHISVLERGHGLAFPIPFFPMDHDEAILCPFLGGVTGVSTKAAAFACQTGAPILPIWCRVDDGSKLCIEIAPALESQSHPSEASLTLALTDHFARRLKASPPEMDWDAQCWYPPFRRLLPSRFPWPLELPAGDQRPAVRPFRMLIRVPDSPRDACLAVPAIRALKRGRPDTHLTVLTTDEMLPFWSLLQECDAALPVGSEPNPDDSFEIGILLNWENASFDELADHSVGRIIGMETHPAAPKLDDALSMPRKLGPPEHRHRTFLRVAHRLGAEVINDPNLRVPMVVKRIEPPIQDEPKKKEKALPRGKKSRRRENNRTNGTTKAKQAPHERLIIGIAPSSEDGPAYAWPSERFLELIKQLGDIPYRWKVFLDAEADLETWESLRAELPEDVDLEPITAPPSLEARLESLSNCRLLLANDNQDLHLAATVHGIATIALYGPSDPIQSAPVLPNALVLRRHVECTPCFLAECPLDHRCLTEISVDEAAAALQVALGENAAPSPTESEAK